MTTLPDAILYPVFGHLALLLFLFIAVSIRRQRASRTGGFDIDALAHKGTEPELSRRYAKNLDNQFQLPMLFYALVALLYATDGVTMVQVVLAWIFLVGRVVHTAVQTTNDNVTLRGVVFTINFLALGSMWLTFFGQRAGLI